MSVLPFPVDARRRAKRRGESPPTPFEFHDVWTDRITRASVTAGSGYIESELRTSNCEAPIPTAFLVVRSTWMREDGHLAEERGEITIAVEDADAFVALMAKLVEQARRDGTLPTPRS